MYEIMAFALVGAPTFTIVYNIPKIVNLAKRTYELHNISSDIMLTSEEIAKRREEIYTSVAPKGMPSVPILNNAISEMVKSYSPEELLLLKNNLATLKVKKGHSSKWNGIYYLDINKMVICKELAITHELNHVASTVGIINNIEIGGFRQQVTPNGKCIGVGLDEGYTENLGNQKAYLRLIAIIPLIEKFYDDNKVLRRNYFEADLPAVIDYFSQIEGRQKALELITSLDTLYVHSIFPTWGNKTEYLDLSIRANLLDMYQKFSGKRNVEEQFFTPEMLATNDPQKLILKR